MFRICFVLNCFEKPWVLIIHLKTLKSNQIPTTILKVFSVFVYRLGIQPNHKCGSITPKNASCIDHAYCNSTSFCVCDKGYKGASCK